MHPPSLTVLMAVNDGERYLRSAMDSILAQSFTDFEFLVIDDCSQDDTPAILRSYHDERIRVFRNPERLGLTTSLNLGLKMARGHYLARQDADDLSFPNRLERQLAYLMEHPGTALLGTWAETLDKDGRGVGEICPNLSGALLKWVMLFKNRITHSSVIFDKEIVLQMGGYSDSMPIAQDYDLWCRLMNTYPIAILPEKLVGLRLHPESVSAKQKDTQNHFTDVVVLRNIRWFCQKDLSLGEVRTLRSLLNCDRVSDPQSIWKCSGVLQDVFRAFVSTRRPTPAERKALVIHYARAIGVMASMHANISRRGTGTIALRAIRHGMPYAFFDKTVLSSLLKLLLGPSAATRLHRHRYVEPDEIPAKPSPEEAGKGIC
jgi:hypothetical protein